MENAIERVKAIRKKLGMDSQQELADVLGCSVSKIKGLERGATKSLKSSDIVTLSHKYGFSKKWLENGTGSMMINNNDLLLEDIQETANILDDNLFIPFYKDVHDSYAYGNKNGEREVANITITKDMLPSVSKNTDAIKVIGNAMMPTISDGDIIFIDKEKTEPIDGKIYVVYLCEEVYIKRLFLNHKTKAIILNSDNPVFPQLKVDCDDFKIIGMVVASMQISRL